MDTKMPDFDFLVKLHKNDPDGLEQFRKHMLREAVDAAPPVHRQSLERLLERIETAHATASNPLDAARIAFRMMSDSVNQLQDAWGQTRCAMAGLQASMLIDRARRA